MIDLELELVRENPHWLTVLCAYQAAHEESRKPAEESSSAEELADEFSPDDLQIDNSLSEVEPTGTDQNSPTESDPAAKSPKIRKAIWLPRLTRVEGVGSEELSRTHGRLIAYGLLKCDLADRSAGVVYQLTSTGKQVIARLSSEAEGSHDEAA